MMLTASTPNFSLSLPSLLMSNASSIDLLVDLKEIQSQMPQVAFFPLWEIKRFNSPCLSTLIIIISPSSPAVRLLGCLHPFHAPPAPLTAALALPLSQPLTAPRSPLPALPRKVSRLSHKLAVCLYQRWGAAVIIVSRRRGCYWGTTGLPDM